MITRHFLGWTGHCSAAVTVWCQEAFVQAMPQRVLFCVPTQQAVRKLRDALIQTFGAFAGWEVITPPSLLMRFAPSARSAPIVTQYKTWHTAFQLVRRNSSALFATLFGQAEWIDDPMQAYKMADRIIQIRRELVEGNYTLAELSERNLCDDSPERWRALAALEQVYLCLLEETGVADPVQIQLCALRNSQPLPEGTRVIMACVPDFMPSLVPLLSDVHADILIAADPTDAARFLEDGRPLPEQWDATHPLAIDDAMICRETSPIEVAERIVHEAFSRERNPEDVCLGIIDPSVIPILNNAFEQQGISPFDPTPADLSCQQPIRLLLALLHYRQSHRLEYFEALAFHEDIIKALDLDRRSLYCEYNTLRCDHLPANTESLSHFVSPETTPQLATLFSKLDVWCGALQGNLATGTRAVFSEVYSQLTVNPKSKPLLYGAFVAIRSLLDSFPLGSTDFDLFTFLLMRQTLNQQREDEVCAYEGRLELIWTEAHTVIVSGMNEGLYPDSTFTDAFLPDHFRRKLNLRNDLTRAARDAYIIEKLIKTHPDPAQLCFIFARHAMDGTPLRPSRFFFYCDHDRLIARAESLFSGNEPPMPLLASQSALHLVRHPFTFSKRPHREQDGIPVFSPSKVKSYLTCPFDYFIKQRIGWEVASEVLLSPDAPTFGTLIHSALQVLADNRLRDIDTLEVACVNKVETLFRENFGSHLTLDLEAAKLAVLGRILAFLPHHLRLRGEGWDVIATEANIHLNLGHCFIQGRIDRIDRHKDGRWRVYDYKTFDKKKTPYESHYRKTKDPAKRIPWLDLQLPIYELGLRSTGGFAAPRDTIELGYALLPATHSDAGVYLFNEYTQDLRTEAYAVLQDVTMHLVADQPTDYWPPKEPSYNEPILRAWAQATDRFNWDGPSDIYPPIEEILT